MASVLIIEDGTGVANANSYASADDARAWAALRGITLPEFIEGSTDPVETLLITAMDYLESQNFIGFQATPVQALSWPRVFNFPYLAYPWYPTDIFSIWMETIDPSYYVLPTKINQAQCQLVIEQNNGIVVMPTTPGGDAGKFVTRERVDVIETSYSERLGTLTTPTMRIVDSLLRGLVVAGGGSAAIRSVRA